MTPYGRWWIPCVLSLSCASLSLSSSATATDGAPLELFIFNELCALKAKPGPCKAVKERFFFNIDTGRCRPFEYGGCRGNANNFPTLAACEETCVVSVDKSPCHLPEAPGPCRGLLTRFLFDSSTQECRSFFYGGCFGNANNFRSLAACQAKCLGHGSSTKAPEVVRERPTEAAETQPLEKDGKSTKAPEVVRERPTEAAKTQPLEKDVDKSPCHLPEDPGPCHGQLPRFLFDSSTQECRSFSYGGCFGNANNFRSLAACQAECLGHEEFAVRLPQLHHAASSEQSAEELTSRQAPVSLRPSTQTAEFKPPALCHAPIAKGVCDGAEKRFAFIPELKKCQMFLFSGCGGNHNNFIHRRRCTRTCMNTRSRAPEISDHGKHMIRIKKKNINSILFHSA